MWSRQLFAKKGMSRWKGSVANGSLSQASGSIPKACAGSWQCPPRPPHRSSPRPRLPSRIHFSSAGCKSILPSRELAQAVAWPAVYALPPWAGSQNCSGVRSALPAGKEKDPATGLLSPGERLPRGLGINTGKGRHVSSKVSATELNRTCSPEASGYRITAYWRETRTYVFMYDCTPGLRFLMRRLHAPIFKLTFDPISLSSSAPQEIRDWVCCPEAL